MKSIWSYTVQFESVFYILKDRYIGVRCDIPVWLLSELYNLWEEHYIVMQTKYETESVR